MSMLLCSGRHLDKQQAIELTDTALRLLRTAVRSSRRLLLGQQTTVRICRAGAHTLHTISCALEICSSSLEGSGVCKKYIPFGDTGEASRPALAVLGHHVTPGRQIVPELRRRAALREAAGEAKQVRKGCLHSSAAAVMRLVASVRGVSRWQAGSACH